MVKSNAPRHDLAAFEGPPEELFDVLMRDIVAEFRAHVELPTQDFLVREPVDEISNSCRRDEGENDAPMKRACERIQARCVRQVRIGERRGDKVYGDSSARIIISDRSSIHVRVACADAFPPS